MPRNAIIIGAGPAGLTAAYELLTRTDIVPIILEKSGEIGGISRTTNYKGNRMDMGPHRFFSKSDRVMDWWLKMMPLEQTADKNPTISYQNKTRTIAGDVEASSQSDKVMLVIRRLTRIYFLRQFFAYPIALSLDTLRTLGLIRTMKIMFSFLWIRLFPRKPEKSLEEFIINKFGKELYLLFFKDYTEKVWGIAPSAISAEWGAQRIKGVSLSKAIASAIKSIRLKKKGASDIGQKDKETSLIEQFLYPKYGPGSLWEEVACQVQEMGGKFYLHQDVKKITTEDGLIRSISTVDSQTGEPREWKGDHFFSSMPVQELIAGMGDSAPTEVQEIAAGLQYRDFINVGLLLRQLSNMDGQKLELKDNWIYIQERDVKVGRLMIYNNWGSGMIKDPKTTWIGMEYFCNKTDGFWSWTDEDIKAWAIKELVSMDLARPEDILDGTVKRMEKTYPAYFGTYERFDHIRAFTDQFANLFLVGRNGMHKYNNADHSMLTAMVAVDNIAAGVTSKANLWAINTEQEYHEEKKAGEQMSAKPTNTPSADLSPALQPFKSWLLKNRLNRTFLWIAGIAILLQFIIFKILYPYAGFIDGDSYVYIESAYYNFNVTTHPIGYPKFLRLFSIFTKSDTALVAFQFLSIQVSALYFMFTLKYFYSPAKLTQWLIFSFILFNPVFLYISNYVTSDSIFLALSLIWVSSLLWILKKPTPRLILLQAIVLLLAFVMRYNALYYPLISTLAFLLSRQPIKYKILGVASSFIVVAGFILVTANQYKTLSGTREFSPFSGWQLANNAMYAYRYVDSAHVGSAPVEYKQLDQMVRHYFDTSRDTKKHPTEKLVANTLYMWDPNSPLNIYMNRGHENDSLTTDTWLARWASMGPIFQGYGSYIIKTYPATFIQHYLIPNACKYYLPPAEFLGVYNSGKWTVRNSAKDWFGYKDNKVSTRFKDSEIHILRFLPGAAGTMNIVFLIGVLFVGILKGVNSRLPLTSTLWLISALWLVNFGFSVFAAPVTLRYQLFSILIFTSFAWLLVDIIYKTAFTRPGRVP